jgi:hypothetical protein
MESARICIIIAIWLSASFESAYSQEDSKYFPTGMMWKEVLAEPNYEMDTTFNHVYEIGKDIMLNEKTYKKVILDGEEISLWLREEGEKIWLLTKEYPHEIKLYDFDWSELPVNMEYLQEAEEGVDLNTWSIAKYEKTCSWKYNQVTEGTTIQGIGRVSELNRNSCLLGYIYPQTVIPGLLYFKVLWIKRNGKEIFRSENPRDWIFDIPEGTDGIESIHNSQCTMHNGDVTYDLSGRKVSGDRISNFKINNPKLQKGIYIQDGRKVVKK